MSRVSSLVHQQIARLERTCNCPGKAHLKTASQFLARALRCEKAFCCRRASRESRALQVSGGHIARVTPVPIPNTVVKPR